ncbi:PGN_0703 family putative restriction endonuclease [Lutibacter flavus]|uniref:PD-(D/E)XK nuclease-like domain-containing protein n=1 Tax=Lutibacter flavus TaxID=691689 RepID=A0A238YWM8_9FLAO|nr:hypothetical protein [Lutibacter flavus]SNR75545.1 hypothetical protein SAMN04488111_2891 [Lutibacter flavus]
MLKSWYNVALEKQLNYKKNVLDLIESGTYGKENKKYPNILSDKDASLGANFYCHKDKDEWQSLKNWANLDKGKKVNFLNTGLKNMLRSEHIPFNLFYPLEKLRVTNPKQLCEFLEKLLDYKINVDEVIRIKIEFASDLHKSKLLNDNTSFDVYIEYFEEDLLCGIGIEIKYTEKSYPYGETEKERMFNTNSEYNSLSKNSGYYAADTNLKLREKKLKQPWRNHLLGVKLIEIGQLQKFHSIHMYPRGNSYQHKVCIEYLDCLIDDYKGTFIPITFEKFIEVSKNILKNDNWVNYLINRY